MDEILWFVSVEWLPLLARSRSYLRAEKPRQKRCMVTVFRSRTLQYSPAV